MSYPSSTIRIADQLLELMAVAAIEAYVLGDGRRKVKLETLGYIWGTRVERAGDLYIHLSRGSVSISANRNGDWVKPNRRAAEIKNAVLARWAPEVSLLGSFHTHPYHSLMEVQNFTGFEFSSSDFEWFLADDYVWHESDEHPIMIAVTICELQRVHESIYGDSVRENVWQFDIGQYRIWINACLGYLDDNGQRACTNNSDDRIFVDLSRFYNAKGDRLD